MYGLFWSYTIWCLPAQSQADLFILSCFYEAFAGEPPGCFPHQF